MGLRGWGRPDGGVLRHLGGPLRDAHPGLRQLPGAAAVGRGRPRLCRQRDVPTHRQRAGVPAADHARTGAVHPLGALHGLGPLGPARSADVERPALLRGRRGTAVAGGARGPAQPVHPHGRLAGAAHLGHGHRRSRRDRGRPARVLPHQPGPDARSTRTSPSAGASPPTAPSWGTRCFRRPPGTRSSPT
jgi:hypothetical protein